MPVQVKGMAELNRAMSRAPKTLKREYTAGQRRVAEPVRSTAESKALAVGNIHKSPQWGRMRTGLTTRLVYVAPRRRGLREGPLKRGQQFASLLMDRAMQPALDMHEAEIVRKFDGFLATMERDWAR